MEICFNWCEISAKGSFCFPPGSGESHYGEAGGNWNFRASLPWIFQKNPGAKMWWSNRKLPKTVSSLTFPYRHMMCRGTFPVGPCARKVYIVQPQPLPWLGDTESRGTIGLMLSADIGCNASQIQWPNDPTLAELAAHRWYFSCHANFPPHETIDVVYRVSPHFWKLQGTQSTALIL